MKKSLNKTEKIEIISENNIVGAHNTMKSNVAKASAELCPFVHGDEDAVR
jgi:hypothetical protein